jgi:hypothetical protein
VPTAQRIAELAGAVADAPTAGEALRKVRELRRELDAFERQQVGRALSEGANFAMIARDLGVSRQAAHRRFRSLASGDASLQASPDARQVIRLAREESDALAARAMDGTHIVLAVLRSGDVPAADVLRRAGATLNRARTQVEAATIRVPLFQRSAGTEASGLRRLLAASAQAAREGGDRQIEVEHLLIGALTDERADAARMLIAIGVDPKAIEADLMSDLVTRRQR